LAYILPVDGDGPVLDVVEAVEQARDRRFAGSRGTNDRHRLSGRYLEGYAPEDRPLRIIGEMDVAEGDRSLLNLQGLRVRPVDHFRLDLQEVEHLLDV